MSRDSARRRSAQVVERLKVDLSSVVEVVRPGAARYYGQFGEDAVLQQLLDTSSDHAGFYVDVGAFSPKTYSNTYWLYRRGWHGINVDATPGSMRAFRLLRRRDVNLELAVTDEPGPVTFYQLGIRTVLNTLSPAVAAQWEHELGRDARRVVVDGVTLRSILERHADGTIDLLSVDVEGHDLAVLRSNDWDRFRPTIVLVEDHTSSYAAIGTSKVSSFLDEVGYDICAWAPPSVFYRARAGTT